MTKAEARAAARARAAEERAAVERRRRRNRVAAITGVALSVLVVAAVVTALVLANPGASNGADRAATGGRTSAPPWAAPADVERQVRAAGLEMLTTEGQVLHIHEHLSITVDGKAVEVPANIGIDEVAQRLSPLHTHDTSGIIHVESPVKKDFRLGQVFTEWDVKLAKGRIGPYVDGEDGVRIGVFVEHEAVTGDPRDIVLGPRQDIDFVITTDGATPKAPEQEFTFPADY